jgi:hypothetical protein
MVNSRAGPVDVHLLAYHRPGAPGLIADPRLREWLDRGDLLVIWTRDEDDRDRFVDALGS